MKIGVVSDTHSQKIPQQLLDEFREVDLIIHAGDFCSLEDLKNFTQMNEVKAVYGNMDDAEVRCKLSARQIIRVGECSIGLCHGEGPSHRVLDFARKEFKDDKVDAVIFGHSHQPMNERINDVLYFNPGSPNDKIFAPFCSYGILEIEDGKINGEIIKII
jgi:uncharacterized protein